MVVRGHQGRVLATVSLLSLVAFEVLAQGASPPASVQPTPGRPSPVMGIRNKVSAGDLLSAESILEVHRSLNGEDDAHLVGLSWLARGALYLGEIDKARRFAAEARARCAAKIAQGNGPANDQAVEVALGAVIEVEAQLVQREKGPARAAELVRGELGRIGGPIALRSRLNKRINMLALVGAPAPEIIIEDFVSEQPTTLASVRGQAVVLFLFANGCPDCEAQVATLARVRTRYAEKGLRLLALTRYYRPEAERAAEKSRLQTAWQNAYRELESTPVVISTVSMERYGGSSTPTFVFVDRAGIVRGYTPTRLTEADLDREVARIVR